MTNFYLVCYCPVSKFPDNPKVIHGADYIDKTYCGKDISYKWWILENQCCIPAKITCPVCRKVKEGKEKL